MPRYTATTSSKKYLKTPNTQHYQDKLTITKHELHNNNNNNNTSQPYNLTTDLRQSEEYKLANTGTRHDPSTRSVTEPRTFKHHTQVPGNPNDQESLPLISKLPGNTRVVHRHNLTPKATVEYTLPHCRQIILQQPTPTLHHPRHHIATALEDRREATSNPYPLHPPRPESTHAAQTDTHTRPEWVPPKSASKQFRGSNNTTQTSPRTPTAFQATSLPFTLVDNSTKTQEELYIGTVSSSTQPHQRDSLTTVQNPTQHHH